MREESKEGTILLLGPNGRRRRVANTEEEEEQPAQRPPLTEHTVLRATLTQMLPSARELRPVARRGKGYVGRSHWRYPKAGGTATGPLGESPSQRRTGQAARGGRGTPEENGKERERQRERLRARTTEPEHMPLLLGRPEGRLTVQ